MQLRPFGVWSGGSGKSGSDHPSRSVRTDSSGLHKILLESLFYVKQFSFEGVDKARMCIVSPEVSHLQSEFEDVHKEKDHAFINCDTFLMCSFESSV